MSRSVIGKYLLIISLFLKLEPANGCSCFPRHPQDVFCSSPYVFVGKVLTETYIPGRTSDPDRITGSYGYKVRVINNLKGNIGSIGASVTLDTAATGASCGNRLSVGSKLLILVGTRRRVGLCESIIEPSSLTFEEMAYYFSNGRNSYKRNCKCQKIRENRSTEFSSTTGCKLPDDNRTKFCYYGTALCRNIRGRCRWRNADCRTQAVQN